MEESRDYARKVLGVPKANEDYSELEEGVEETIVIPETIKQELPQI